MRAITAILTIILLGAAAYGSEAINYRYDTRGRLVGVDRNQVINNAAANVVTNYSYDKADNRLTKNTTGSPNPP